MDLLEGLATTRAIRRYRPDPIPEADLDRILWHATRAPSGSNRQPFRFLVLRDGPRATEARRVLGEGFRAAWAAKRAADGYAEGSGADASSPKARMAATMQHFVDHVEEVPAIVLAAYGRHRAADPTEGAPGGSVPAEPALLGRRVGSADVYPACQNLLLAARALGYGGVLTMWHKLVEDDLRPILAIPDDIALAATICLGRPVGRHGPVRRRPVAELVFEDAWGDPAPWATDPPGTRFTRAGPPGS